METILIVIEVFWVLGFLAVFGVYFYWRRKVKKMGPEPIKYQDQPEKDSE